METISYNDHHGFRGTGDLYLPEQPTGNYPVLLIHGGGWSAMDKSGVAGIAEFLCGEAGYPVYNINYRLCGATPWPACGDDCLDAAEFLFNSSTPCVEKLNRKKIFIIGGSAGGHLALMTGLRLPPEQVAGIVSISGIAALQPDVSVNPDRYKLLFGKEPDTEMLMKAEPAVFLKKESPPLLLTHEYSDKVVPKESADLFLKKAAEIGIFPETYFYHKEETDYSHMIWIPGSDPHKLYPELESRIRKFLKEHTVSGY